MSSVGRGPSRRANRRVDHGCATRGRSSDASTSRPAGHGSPSSKTSSTTVPDSSRYVKTRSAWIALVSGVVRNRSISASSTGPSGGPPVPINTSCAPRHTDSAPLTCGQSSHVTWSPQDERSNSVAMSTCTLPRSNFSIAFALAIGSVAPKPPKLSTTTPPARRGSRTRKSTWSRKSSGVTVRNDSASMLVAGGRCAMPCADRKALNASSGPSARSLASSTGNASRTAMATRPDNSAPACAALFAAA